MTQESNDWHIPPLRLGIVPYLNVQPMVYGVKEKYPQLDLVFAPPSQLERMLRQGEIDLGILPVFAAFLAPGRAIHSAPVIAAQNEVYSVLIVSRVPIEQARRIARDANSLTSNALSKVLLREYWKVDAELVGPEDADSADGRVIIGDPAIRAHDLWPHVYDLGSAWHDWTELPFVFAAWVGRSDVDTGQLRQLLEASVEKNLKRLPEVVESHRPVTDIPRELCVRYLRDNLSFGFGENERRAIECFHAACMEHGVVEPGELLWK